MMQKVHSGVVVQSKGRRLRIEGIDWKCSSNNMYLLNMPPTEFSTLTPIRRTTGGFRPR